MQPTSLIPPDSEVCYSCLDRALETPKSIFDERYIDGLRDRNPEVEAHFVAYFQLPLRAKARHQLWTPDLSEDACQETMLRVVHYFRQGKRLENPARLPAFVMSFCHKIILEMNRLKYRYQYLPDDWDLPGMEPDPYVVLRQKELQQLVWKILDKLRSRDRALLIAVLQGMDKEEMCRQFQVTPKRLQELLWWARKRFRKELEKLGGVEQVKGEGAD